MYAFYFFFQAEDGIRDWSVTGVQTCALPISAIYSPSPFAVAFPTNVISPTNSPPGFAHVLLAISQLAKPAAERPVALDALKNTCVKLPATLRRPFCWFKEVTGPSTPPPSGDQVFPLMLYCAM